MEKVYGLEIRAMLSSGWESERVCRHLNMTRNAELTVEDVEAIRKDMPEEMFLTPAQLQERVGDFIADPLGEMARILKVQSDRLVVALAIEDVKGSRVPYVDAAVKNYWRLLKEYTEILQSLGELPVASAKQEAPPVPLLGDGIPTMRLLLTKDAEVIDGTVTKRSQLNTRSRAPQLLTR